MSREWPSARVVDPRAYDALIREVSGEGQVHPCRLRRQIVRFGSSFRRAGDLSRFSFFTESHHLDMQNWSC